MTISEKSAFSHNLTKLMHGMSIFTQSDRTLAGQTYFVRLGMTFSTNYSTVQLTNRPTVQPSN